MDYGQRLEILNVLGYLIYLLAYYLGMYIFIGVTNNIRPTLIHQSDNTNHCYREALMSVKDIIAFNRKHAKFRCPQTKPLDRSIFNFTLLMCP